MTRSDFPALRALRSAITRAAHGAARGAAADAGDIAVINEAIAP